MSVLKKGEVLSHYRIEGLLGAGGMGEVYRATDLKLNRPVAIKLLLRWDLKDRVARQRLMREARSASARNHPHIVTIYAVEKVKSLEFIVMEYVEGVTLAARLEQGPLSWRELQDIGVLVGEALGDAHSTGLIHRDIKPSNIMLTARGPKLMDFGLAKSLHRDSSADDRTSSDLTGSGVIVGTVLYMSPEQTRGEALDPASDVFSFGVTLYEASTGRKPFTGKSTLAVFDAIARLEPPRPSEVRPDLPPAFDDLLVKALRKDPGNRHRHAGVLAEELKGIRADQHIRQPEHNLPGHLTRFIGRDRERGELRRLIAESRLVTLTGPGGCGKTRLALQIGSDALSDFRDGICVVELASLADPSLVPFTVAAALGVQEGAGGSILSSLVAHLASKHLLLILDNCEHLAAACASMAEALLRVSPGLHVLATSREALGVTGETRWRVPSLSGEESVQLFSTLARAASPRFVLDDTNARVVAEICSRLDGIPLAIELAAARVNVLSVESLLSRLQDRFQVLTGGSRTALARQQTLRATVDWSYGHLDDDEKRLFSRLSVFRGGFSLDDAESICSSPELERSRVLDVLARIVDKSLVVVDHLPGGQDRYRQLETLREYASERARELDEADHYRTRHAEHFLDFAEGVEPQLQGSMQRAWFDALHLEHDNLRHAIYTFTEAGAIQNAARLAGALWRFWWVRGHWTEGRGVLARLLEGSGVSAESGVRSKALHAAAVLACGQGDYDGARAHVNERLAIDRARGDMRGVAAALFELGNIANDREELDDARTLYEESLRLRRDLSDEQGISSALHSLGVIAQEQNDFDAAKRLYGEALMLHRKLGNRAWEAASLNGLGGVARYCEDFEGARSFQQMALAIQRELGDQRGMAFSLRELARVADGLDDVARAEAHLRECLGMLLQLGDRQGIAESLEVLSSLRAARGDAEKSLWSAGAAAALRRSIDAPIPQMDEAWLERRLSKARAILGSSFAAKSFGDGAALEPDAVIRAAREWSDGTANETTADLKKSSS